MRTIWIVNSTVILNYLFVKCRRRQNVLNRVSDVRQFASIQILNCKLYIYRRQNFYSTERYFRMRAHGLTGISSVPLHHLLHSRSKVIAVGSLYTESRTWANNEPTCSSLSARSNGYRYTVFSEIPFVAVFTKKRKILLNCLKINR